jgi:DNA-binding CsgD family transcriptional regulator
MTTPADFGDDALLARLWLRAGATDRLPRLMEVTGARAAANPGNDLVAAIHHQVVGLATGDTSRLRSAVDLLRRCERPMLLASALEDLGTAEHGAGLDATTSWRAAADVYERCDAVRETARVLKRLRGIGVRRAPKAALNHRGALSPRERQVADRLAGGATTRQIASDLSISQSTVITHVRHIYEKWGISTRRALIDRARR